MKMIVFGSYNSVCMEFIVLPTYKIVHSVHESEKNERIGKLWLHIFDSINVKFIVDCQFITVAFLMFSTYFTELCDLDQMLL